MNTPQDTPPTRVTAVGWLRMTQLKCFFIVNSRSRYLRDMSRTISCPHVSKRLNKKLLSYSGWQHFSQFSWNYSNVITNVEAIFIWLVQVAMEMFNYRKSPENMLGTNCFRESVQGRISDFSKFSTPTIAFLAFRLAKKLRLRAIIVRH